MSTTHHDHAHEHAHDHDHDHDHDGDTFYLDQICMVGISGAFGAICLALYITSLLSPSTSMLGLLLGPQFHLFVLGSGIALVLVAGIRGVSLWRRVGQPAHAHDHDHAHGHDHGEQGCCGEHH